MVMDEESRPLNMEWRERKTSDGKRGITYIPAKCTVPDNCISCYVVRLHDGNPAYCGNPRILLNFKAMTEGKTIEEMVKVTNGKPFADGGRLFIPKGAKFGCKNCEHTWTTNRARKPSVKTGIRCPKCHSRDVINADGTVIEGVPKKRSHTVRMEAESPPSDGEGVTAEFSKTKKRATPETLDAVDRVKERFRKDRQAPSGELPEPEPTDATVGRQRGGLARLEDTDLLSAEELAEIFDPETFEMLHELEVQALCNKLNKPRFKSYEKAIKSLARKSSLILKLVFRSPDIELALKIVIGLYILQQITLIGAIMAGTEIGFKADGKRLHETTEEDGEE